MRYFVYAPNGQRFGPADLPTLQQWVAEGRVLPNSLLEEELSGTRLAAGTLGELRFPTQAAYMGNPTFGPPTQPGQTPYAPYHRPGHAPRTASTPELTTSFVCSSLAAFLVFSCGCFPILGFVATALAAVGMVQGKKARDNGHPQGNAAHIFGIVMLVLSILSAIGGVIFMLAGFGMFNFGVGSVLEWPGRIAG